MNPKELTALVEKQREFFFSEKTRSYEARRDALIRLKEAVVKHEKPLCEALAADLRKTDFETYMTEIGMVLDDLGYVLKHLRKWMKPRHVKTPVSQFKGSSFIVPEPYGVALILGPWNYPIQLCLEPLTAAIAGGNTAILRVSAHVPKTAGAIADLIADAFDPEYVASVQGEEIKDTILDEKFDYIFFTGSPKIGHMVMEKAAKHLTPVSLELGGKSPVIIEKSADLKMAARRVAFGKYLNAGQTCVAPDYVVIDQSVKEEFLSYLIPQIRKFFPGEDYSDMPRIISDRHFDRLMGLIEGEKVLFGGKGDRGERFIEPTVLDGITFDSRIMQEEIFGPVMPLVEYTDLNPVLDRIGRGPKPLALYLFTSDKAIERQVLQTCSFGGGCINDTIIHLANENMGFGGVGNSGMGSYHGKRSFDTFTHYKSIIRKATWIDLPMRYHPYTEKNFKILKMFLK